MLPLIWLFLIFFFTLISDGRRNAGIWCFRLPWIFYVLPAMLSRSRPLQAWMDYAPNWARVTFRQMLYYGVHLGHSLANSNPLCGWMISGHRQGLLLIDLFKFSYMLRVGLFALEGAVRHRGPVWFIHPQQGGPIVLREGASRCGEYFIHYPWIGGLITNHRVVRRSLRVQNLQTEVGRGSSKRRIWDSSFTYDRWRFSRKTWPRALYISSARRGLKPCHEAQRIGLPALTLSDTNSSASLASFAIPANDESVTALWFYTNLISLFILHRKFSAVNRFLGRSHRRSIDRTGRRSPLMTTVETFASRDLWRRTSPPGRVLERASPGETSFHNFQPHPWMATLATLYPWSAPWLFVGYRRTRRWFIRALAAPANPPFNRFSTLLPRWQRNLVSPFGRDSPFHRLTGVRGAYRSRSLWVFYQIFASFVLAFTARWSVLTGRGFRRLWRRPRLMPWTPRRRRWGGRSKRPFLRLGRFQRIRHPWASFSKWSLNIEAQAYPKPPKINGISGAQEKAEMIERDPTSRMPPRRWGSHEATRVRYGRRPLQISRYAARFFFAQWFVHQC